MVAIGYDYLIVKFYKGQEEHDGYIWDYYVNYAVKVETMSKESSIRHSQIHEIFHRSRWSMYKKYKYTIGIIAWIFVQRIINFCNYGFAYICILDSQ